MRRDRYDICIIGSGAGAGPVAYELSKAGFSVVVLEKGPWIKTSQFTKDEIVAARRDVYYPSSKDEPQVIEWFDKKGNLHSKSNAGGGTGDSYRGRSPAATIGRRIRVPAAD
jgi:choline dehydrogenase-like flavoprotein